MGLGCNATESGVDTPYDPVMLADPRPGSITGFPYVQTSSERSCQGTFMA